MDPEMNIEVRLTRDDRTALIRGVIQTSGVTGI